MSDIQQADSSQADSTHATSTDDDQQPGGSQTQAVDVQAVKDLPKWAQDEIGKLRKESAASRTKLQQIADRDKTDLQKAQDAAQQAKDDAATISGKYRMVLAEQAVRDAADAAGAISAKLVFRYVKDDLQFDDEGNLTNLEAVLKAAKRDEPKLFGKGTADGGKGGGSQNGATNMNTLLRQKAGVSG